MGFLENQIQETLKSNELNTSSSRIKLMVFRNEGGLYLPETNDISFVIKASKLENDFYLINNDYYEVDLFKDFFIAPGLLSTLKTNNKAINVVGSIFAKENKLQNCLLLNTDKHVIEALNGNIFVVKGNVIKTPPLSDGCLKGIMRKQLMEIINEIPEYNLLEASVSPFELQQADELWISNVIVGMQPITKYRKKLFVNEVSKILLQKLNVKMRLT
jgi:branched-chain amino acid aminotransferase